MLSVNVNSRTTAPLTARRNRPCRPKLLHEFCVPSGCWRIYLLCTATPRQPSGFSLRWATNSFLIISLRTSPIDGSRSQKRSLGGPLRLVHGGIIGGCRKLDKIVAAVSTPPWMGRLVRRRNTNPKRKRGSGVSLRVPLLGTSSAGRDRAATSITSRSTALLLRSSGTPGHELSKFSRPPAKPLAV